MKYIKIGSNKTSLLLPGYESNASVESDTPFESDEYYFCDKNCVKYFSGCICTISIMLLLLYGLTIIFAPLGLLLVALLPGMTILFFTKHLYSEHVTTGQMIVSFMECIIWMIPLLVWDSVWEFVISRKLKDGGLCDLCLLSYVFNLYFLAGFCEEFIKFLCIRRIQHSTLTRDWRSLLVYGKII